MESKESNNIETDSEPIKIILIGDSGTGKTNLITVSAGYEFNSNALTTRACSFIQKTFIKNNKEVKVNIWDTIGQEKYRSLTKIFVKEAKIVILVYDITNRTSFDNLEKWMESVNDTLGTSNKYAVILMGNKADLEEKRKVTYEEAEDKCKKYNIFWGGECSVQEMSLDELNEKFQNIIREIYKVVGEIQDKKPIVKKLSTHQRNKKKNNNEACLC